MPAELLKQESQRLVLAMTERVMFLQAQLDAAIRKQMAEMWSSTQYADDLAVKNSLFAGLGPGPGEQPAVRSRTPAESSPLLLPEQPSLRSASLLREAPAA